MNDFDRPYGEYLDEQFRQLQREQDRERFEGYLRRAYELTGADAVKRPAGDGQNNQLSAPVGEKP